MRPSTASRKVKALELLADGQSPLAMAEQLDLSVRTIRRYLADPEVKERLRALQDERLGALSRRALNEAGPALGLLRSVAEDGEGPASARVSAAKALLEVALRLVEVSDLAERVGELEAALGREQRGELRGRIWALRREVSVDWQRLEPHQLATLLLHRTDRGLIAILPPPADLTDGKEGV